MPRFWPTKVFCLLAVLAWASVWAYEHLLHWTVDIFFAKSTVYFLVPIALSDALSAWSQPTDHELTAIAQSYASSLGIPVEVRVVRDNSRFRKTVERVDSEIRLPRTLVDRSSPGVLHYLLARELLGIQWERARNGHIGKSWQRFLAALCTVLPILLLIPTDGLPTPYRAILTFSILFSGVAIAGYRGSWQPGREAILQLDRDALDLTRDEYSAIEALGLPALNPKPKWEKPDETPTAEDRVNALRNRHASDLMTLIATDQI